MRPAEIDAHPEKVHKAIELASGQAALLRPLTAADEALLADYFLGLSPATTGVYGPHAFDRETAARLCAELDSGHTLRLLATTRSDGAERVIAYFILIFGVRDPDRERFAKLGIALDPATDCTLAPSVADAYQSAGLGSQMLTHLFAVARDCGRRRVLLWGGVRADNPRAYHFYQKFGLRKVGEFFSRVDNYDMIGSL